MPWVGPGCARGRPGRLRIKAVSMNIKPEDLTPGVLNPVAENAFLYGGCAALAIAIHDETGWPIVMVTDSHNVFDGEAGGGSALHWVVRRPDGLYLDVLGSHTEEELLEEYGAEADEGEAALGVSTREDALEWHAEGSGGEISVEVARSFVPAVLELE